MLRKLVLIPFLALSLISLGQRGKHFAYTVTSTGTQLNQYVDVTANIAPGATSILVSNNALTSAFFTTALGPGDLVMIIQMQGATMDINTTPAAPAASGGWNSGYTLSQSAMNDLGNMNNYRSDWGAVTAYNNAGNYELAEVRSITSTTGITFNCALVNAYTASGHVQVVRIPRLTNLTFNANTSIVPATWNGTTGGVVALEVNGSTTFNTNSKITASGFGFRGGVIDNVTPAGGPAGSATDFGKPGVTSGTDAAEKGEGIGGYTTEYAALYSRYGLGAPANGGGGGNFRNAGGGGGSNVGSGTYNGKGVPNTGYATSWNLETVGMSGSPSSGGGRGGYTLAQTDQNELTLGPNQTAWGGDYRRNEGGLGGHPLTYSASKLFMGGGGGAGEQDVTVQGGSGGNGGGIVYVKSYGAISGAGTIETNGNNGQNSNPSGAAAGTAIKKGTDGAGGAGAGGAIVISNGTALPNTLALSANGGNGGNNAITFGSFTSGLEADGPGGGGSGGQISYSSGSPVLTLTGGTNGTVIATGLTNIVANFPPNGATSGAAGTSLATVPFFDINVTNASLCAGNSTVLTATVVGTAPGTITWYNAQFGGSTIGTGLTYTTPVLAAGTYTYYVGTCPSTFRKPVVVTVGGPTISGTAVVTNATCSTAGSITGLTTSGGAPTPVITWNGVVTPTMTLSGASAGSYTVTVTDGIGCTATSGPYTIGSTGGPTINTSAMVVTNANCLGNNGSITGITASGTGLMPSWSNGPATMNNTGLAPGNYTLTVTDNNGCTATAGPIAIGLNPGPSINASGIVVANATCGNSNGSITGITATGTSLTYSWNGTTTPSANYTSLNTGAYTLTVTDNLGCTATYGPVNISNTTGPTLNLTNQVNVNEHCGQADGSITGIQVIGGAPSLTISWNGGAYSTLNISGLTAGAYSLSVSDANGCIATAGPFNLVNIAGPTINTAGMVITNESCLGGDGSITGITATGNSALTVLWSNTDATLDITGLSAGNYGLSVTDAFGCFAVAGPFAVGLTAGPSINSSGVTVVNETCTNGNGSITGLTVTGSGLTYDWSGTATTGPNYSGLSAGQYTLTVTDNVGCTATYGPVNITNTAGPTLNFTNQVNVNEHCSQADGSITGIQIVGGAPTYTVSWNSGAYSTLNINGLSAGAYSLLVTDFNGCTVTAGPFNLTNVAGPTINTTNIVITNESCAGNDGAIGGITVSGTGLTYQWNSVSSPLNLINHAAGNYTLVVTDGFGCTATAGPFTIGASTTMTLDSSNMVVSPAGCTMDIGAIEGLQIVGGVNPNFTWSNGNPTLDNTDLAPGTYTITVTDDQMCSITASFVVGSTTPPQISSAGVSYSTAHCGQNDGAINSLVVTGGIEPYTYVWDGVASNNSLNLSGTTSGNHTLVVTDSVGCTATVTLTVPGQTGPTINMAGLQVTNATCGLPNGSINGILVTGNGAITYAWAGSNLTSLNLFGLSAGNYTLTATDGFGCQTTSPVVNVTTTPTINADFTISPSGDLLPGTTATFTDASTGATAVNWVWTSNGSAIGTASTASHLYSAEGDYTITLVVQSASGCIDSISKTISVFTEMVIPNVITRNADNTNDLFVISNLKPNAKLVVENRWGNVVYETDNYKNDWDGTDMGGLMLVEGTYFYQLITVEGKVWQGNVYLLNH